jgi:kanamycin kinase
LVELRDNIPDGPVDAPDAVRALARGPLEAVWRNELGGLTFRDGDRYIKWSPVGGLSDERARIQWAAPFTPVPEVLDGDDTVLVTRALPGAGAVTDRWRADPGTAVRAIAEGLRSLHETLPVDGCPWAWRDDTDDIVVCHGDPCAPNTIIGDDGRWSGHVDLGALGTANRWADLAVCSMSLDWNFGDGWQPLFFEAYGIAPDPDRIRHYRALWNDEP